VRLKQKLSAASDAVKSFFTGKAAEADPAVVKLEALQQRMVRGWSSRGCLLLVRRTGCTVGPRATAQPWCSCRQC
jgi:hypothetical protein